MIITQTFWTYMVSYDLRNPGRDYSKLIDGIKQVAHASAPVLKSDWLIFFFQAEDGIRDELKPLLDESDVLLVVKIRPEEFASYNLDQTLLDWLKEHSAGNGLA